MKNLVLIRHGQSQWNKENRFTGWTDVPLSPQGKEEAAEAGRLLKSHGFHFELAFTSVLSRAIKTLWIVLEELDQMWVPVEKSWRLNERHYGALQGLNKAETIARHGEAQVHEWRRGYSIRPPALEDGDPRSAFQDPRYATVPKSSLPKTESLEDTLTRVLPYWSETLAPALQHHGNLIVAAHGNSIRALVKHFKKLSDEEIMGVEIPTGSPYVFQFRNDLTVSHSFYLKDEPAR